MAKSLIQRSIDGIRFLYNQTHWFTDKEAWWIYRLFAFGELLGWSLLLSAIACRALDVPHADQFVTVAGRTHGILFVAYYAFTIATARSMGWGFWRFVGAILAGIPPFTSIIFEQIMAFHRRRWPVVISPPSNVNDD